MNRINNKKYLRDYYQKTKNNRNEKIICFYCLKKITKQNYNKHLTRCKVLHPKKIKKTTIVPKKDFVLYFD